MPRSEVRRIPAPCLSARDPTIFDAKLYLIEADKCMSAETRKSFMDDLFKTVREHDKERQEKFAAFIATHGSADDKQRYGREFGQGEVHCPELDKLLKQA